MKELITNLYKQEKYILPKEHYIKSKNYISQTEAYIPKTKFYKAKPTRPESIVQSNARI